MFAVPSKKEIAQSAQPVPRQPRMEARRPPIIVARVGGKRADLPAGGGCAGHRFCAFAQDKKRDAAFLAEKRQPAARHQIESAGRAAKLQHHGADMRTGQNIGGGGQRVVGMGCAEQEQIGRVASQFQKACGGQGAILQRLIIRPDPEQGFAFRGLDGEAGREAAGPPVAREDFMQRPRPQPPAQHGIRRRQAQGEGGTVRG